MKTLTSQRWTLHSFLSGTCVVVILKTTFQQWRTSKLATFQTLSSPTAITFLSGTTACGLMKRRWILTSQRTSMQDILLLLFRGSSTTTILSLLIKTFKWHKISHLKDMAKMLLSNHNIRQNYLLLTALSKLKRKEESRGSHINWFKPTRFKFPPCRVSIKPQ